MPIQSLFPVPIFYEQLEISDNESTVLIDYLLEHFDISSGSGNMLQSPGNLQNIDLFKKLKNSIEERAEYFWSSIGYKKQTMRTTQMWANLMKDQGFINEHYHSNSLISAIFYLKIPEGSGNTVFTEPFSGIHRMITTTIEKNTEYNSHEFSANAKKNQLILFPSYLNHYSQPNFTKEFRITISLNLLPAELGDFKSLNYVKI